MVNVRDSFAALLAAYAVLVGLADMMVSPLGESSASCMVDRSMVNDGYCDCPDGSDERNTSACSHTGVRFTCSNGAETISIPTSRVQDGVCDCCDGSDEIGSPFPSNCRDTCADGLLTLRKDALAGYRTIQSGLRARSSIVSKWRNHKDNEKRSHDALVAERQEVLGYLANMKYFLQKEGIKEEILRFTLIREREYACGDGFDSHCDYFHSEYLNDQELADYGFQARHTAELSKATGQSKAEPKRFVYTYSEQEKAHAESLKGVKRITSAICIGPLLPDDDMRIFTSVGDYLNFIKSPGGQTHAAAQNKRRRQEENIFNRYLDNGDRGLRMLWVTAAELVGLAASPLTLLLRAVGTVSDYCSNRAWAAVVGYNAENKQKQGGMASVLVPLSQLIIDSNDEKSHLYRRYIRYLDYRYYSVLNGVVDFVQARSYSLIWLSTIAWHSPALYYQYYIMGRSAEMPSRRQSCLLRNGIAKAEEEMAKLTKQIADFEEVQRLILSYKQQPTTSSSKAGTPVNSKLTKLLADYGPMREWESVADVCVSKTVSEYNFTYCFFDSLTQRRADGTGTVYSLGSFAHWGRKPDAMKQFDILQHAIARAEEQKAAELMGDDWMGVKEFMHNLLAAPKHFYRLFYSYLSLTEAGLRDAQSSWALLSKQLFGTHSAPIEKALDQLVTVLVAHNDTFYKQHNMLSVLNETAYNDRLNEEVDQYYNLQTYAQGTGCLHVRPDLYRSSVIHFDCGAEHAIASLQEVDTCRYEALVRTPLACSAHIEQQALQRLDTLGVFGFSKPKKSNLV